KWHTLRMISYEDGTENEEKLGKKPIKKPIKSARIEEFLFEKLDWKVPSRITNAELLGQYIRSNVFLPGNTLEKVGECEKRLGEAEKEFLQTSAISFLTPLRNFLEGDWRTISKERRLLENLRLDLDACKTRVKKAKVAEAKAAAEHELRIAQTEFDRQAEVTRLLLEGISSTHVNHLRCLHEFVEAQAAYYKQCHLQMQELQKELGSMVTEGSSSPVETDTLKIEEVQAPATGTRKARVLYDYDAADSSELSLLADELITVYTVPGMDSDWLIGEKGNHKGKVPVTYLELLS
uniref:Endophilin-B2 n=1 Tax=Neolamprologus brichardi TaxID=32507 RepID=A0A3Q4H4G5_NEOBR